MLTIYIICAVVGGVILVIQLVLSVTGVMGDHGDLGDVDAGHIDVGGHGDAGGHGDVPDHGDVHHEQDSSSFFKLLSLRTLVAALTFFGLGGGLADAAGSPDILSFVFGIMLGGVAMVVVAWLFSLLQKLHEEGNIHVEYALGAPAVVYITIPGNRQGMGKVTVNVQDCSMEYNAVTAGDTLPTGKTVTVLDIIDATTVEVAEQVQ